MLFADAFSHVLDSPDWEIFESLHLHIPLPGYPVSPNTSWFSGPRYGITKYSILMMLAAGLILWIYVPLARRIQRGEAPTGKWWNFFESILTFTRNEIARPYIGKEADRYVPYLWTTFLFVSTSNLLGMLPFMGSPTASFAVTTILALGTYVLITVSSIVQFGLGSYLKT